MGDICNLVPTGSSMNKTPLRVHCSTVQAETITRLWSVIATLTPIKTCSTSLPVILEKRKNRTTWRLPSTTHAPLSARATNGPPSSSISWMTIPNWRITTRLTMMVLHAWCNAPVIPRTKETFSSKPITSTRSETTAKLKVVCVLPCAPSIMIFWCRNSEMEILKTYRSLMTTCATPKISTRPISSEHTNLGDGARK